MPRYLFLILALIAGLTGFSAPLHAADAPQTATPAISYFPVLPLGAAPDATTRLVPVVDSPSLDGTHPGITRAIVVIHDSQRNAEGAFTAISALAGAANATTIILAPQFLLWSDLVLYQDVPKPLLSRFVYWSADTWASGGDSAAGPPQRPVSSFAVIDLMLMYLSEKSFFPDLKDIVIAGHGGGADFVQRYAAIGRAPIVLGKQGTPVRFLVANASSYLYFTASRPKHNSVGFGTDSATSCGHFNEFPYGLQKPNGYTERVGANAIKTNYADRRIMYLVGENIPAANPFPDRSCQALEQGANDLAREVNYSRYIFQLYGDTVIHNQKFYIIPKTAYDPVMMFGSACGMAALFGDGACTSDAPTQKEIPQ